MDEIDMKWKASNKAPQGLNDLSEPNNFLQLPPIHVKHCVKGVEIWEVKKLSDKIVFDLRPSGTVARIVEKDRQQHNEAVMNMDKELKETIQEAEKRIQYERNAFDHEITTIIVTSQKTVHDLCVTAFSVLKEPQFLQSWDKVKFLCMIAKTKLDSFYAVLQGIEKERVEKTKVTLRKYYQILRNINYLLPYDLQKLFENEMLKLNQMTVNNLRCHADLREHKLMLLAKIILISKNKIECHRMSWCELKIPTIERKQSSVKFDSGSGILKTISSSDFTRRMDHTLGRIADLLARWQGQTLVEDKPELDLTSNMETAIKNLSVTIENLMSLYKQGLVNMYIGVYDILAALHQDIENTHIYSTNAVSDRDFRFARTFDRLSETASHMTNVETMSSEVMLRLQMELKKLFRFVYEASAPWDYRVSRSMEARCLIQGHIKKLIYSKAQVSDKEQRFNILLNSLRQESNEDKLNKTLDNVIGCLNDILSSYEEDFEKEKSVVEEYYNLVETQYNLLSSQVALFQLRNPQESFKAYHNMEPQQEEQSIYIPQALRVCEAQMVTLHKWRYGLWEGIKFATDNAFQDIEEHSYNWVTSNIAKAKKRLELKMMLHIPRYERVLSEIFLVRQAELMLHAERFDMHREGMVNILSSMNENLEKLVSKLRDSFEEEKMILEETWEKIKGMSKQCNAANFACQVDGLTKKFTEEAENMLSQYEETCLCQLAWLQKSNLAFLHSIRLFSEGGNFCPETAELIATNLERLNKIIVMTEDDIKKQIKKYKATLPKEISASVKKLSYELQLLLVDLKFVDKVVLLIKLCQEDIKHEVFGLKYKGKMLHQQAFEAICGIPEEDLGLMQPGVEKRMSAFQNKSEGNLLTVPGSKKKKLSSQLTTSKANIYLENRSKMFQLSSLTKYSGSLSPEVKSPKTIKNQYQNTPVESTSSMQKVLKKQLSSKVKSVLSVITEDSTKVRSKNQFLQQQSFKTTSTHKLQEAKSVSKVNISPSKDEEGISIFRSSFDNSLCKVESILMDQSNQAELISNMKYHFTKWTELLKSLTERQNYLLQPTMETPEDDDDTGARTKLLQLKYSSHIKLIDKKMVPLSIGNKSYYNYQGMLFGSTDVPPSDDSFMCHICTYLWNTFSEIQQLTAEYFAKKGLKPIIKTEYIQPTYNMFMEDVLKKFKYYHQQCEEVWLEQVEDFISLVLKIQAAVLKYREQYIGNFHGKRSKAMKEYLVTVTSKVTEEVKKSLNILEVLDQKLKPLHGYPGNRKLLEALNTEVMETTKSLKENVISMTEKSKMDIVQMRDLASLEMQTIINSSGDILQKLLNPVILEDLESQKEAYYCSEEDANIPSEEPIDKSSMEVLAKPSSELQGEEKKTKAKEEEVAVVNPVINEHLERKPVPSIHRLSLDSRKLNEEVGNSQLQIPELQEELEIPAEVTKENEDYGRKKSISTSSNSTYSTSTLQSTISTNIDIKGYMQMFQDAVDVLDDQQSLYENKTEKWLQIWNVNVQKVQQLYSVKLSDCQIRYKQNLNIINE